MPRTMSRVHNGVGLKSGIGENMLRVRLVPMSSQVDNDSRLKCEFQKHVAEKYRLELGTDETSRDVVKWQNLKS